MTQAKIDDYKDTQRKSSIVASTYAPFLFSGEGGTEEPMYGFKWIYMQSVVIESEYNTLWREKYRVEKSLNSTHGRSEEWTKEARESTNGWALYTGTQELGKFGCYCLVQIEQHEDTTMQIVNDSWFTYLTCSSTSLIEIRCEFTMDEWVQKRWASVWA